MKIAVLRKGRASLVFIWAAAHLRLALQEFMVEKLVHELWRDPDGLTTVCLAGPNGDEARSQLDPQSELVWVFKASSHYEAMTLYYNRMGWGKYQTDQEWDTRPYPTKWIGAQTETMQDWEAFHEAKFRKG